MEWRSLSIHKAWMLVVVSVVVSSGKLLASSQIDLGYYITIDEMRRLRFLCLHFHYQDVRREGYISKEAKVEK
jgi:hypothetical protein